MATKYIESYYKYFLWNEGLLEYFFENNQNTEVILNIDGDILKTIVNQNEELSNILLKYPNSIIDDDQSIDNFPEDSEWYKERFLATVELFCGHYNEYITPCKKREYSDRTCTKSKNKEWQCKYFQCIDNNNRKDVLSIANHIIEKEITYYKREKDDFKKLIKDNDKKAITFKLPFFAIVIYIILKFDNGRTQGWANLPNINVNSRRYIDILWNTINAYNKRFDPNASCYIRNENRTNNDYVGKIKYHLPLSQTEIRLLRDAIYVTNVWRRYNEMSFSEIILELSRELEYQGYDVWKKILQGLSTNRVLQRKIEEQVESFDIDKYKEDLENTHQEPTNRIPKLRGEFVLGIYFPDDEDEENKIVLLTTVSEDKTIKVDRPSRNYEIRACGDELYRNKYNKNFVKINGNNSLNIQDYSYENRGVRISQMRIDDVVFFYKYSDNLYIQTREIILKPSYIVAVRNNEETINEFQFWCNENGNTTYRELTSENVRNLYGNDWRIYLFRCSLNVNGQYYTEQVNQINGAENTEFEIKGGIKDNQGKYFVNALPYIEVSENIDVDDVELYFGIDNNIEINYTRINKGNKIIIDVDANTEIAENSICSITAEWTENENTRIHSDFKVTTKTVEYNQDNLHKYNKFAQLIHEDNGGVLQGNRTGKTVLLKGTQLIQNLSTFESVDDSFYFVNLLAACCFDSQNSEITKDKFTKCVSYAATRLGIDEGQDGFMKKLRYLLSLAGFISVDYSTSNYKYQAIPPAFSRVIVSNLGALRTQMIMLSGCYSRKFINDLLAYCNDRRIGIYKYSRLNANEAAVENFLPPIILLQYNFNVDGFVKEKGHICDKLSTIDLPSSIIDSISDIDIDEIQGILNLRFEKIDTQSLEKPYTTEFPRIRKKFVNGNRYYIENEQNQFARLSDNSLLPWANIYCGLKKNNPIVSMKGTKLYVAKKMQLPIPILRALYMTGLGLPDTKKVFICNNKGSDQYYHEMNVYDCLRVDMCRNIVDKLKGKETLPNKYYSMELWSLDQEQRFSNTNNRYRYYLLLKNNNEIIAIACGKRVYIKRNESYCMIDGTMNDVFSYLIGNGRSWTFVNNNEIGVTANGGTQIVERRYTYSTDNTISLPEQDGYKIEIIEII